MGGRENNPVSLILLNTTWSIKIFPTYAVRDRMRGDTEAWERKGKEDRARGRERGKKTERKESKIN
jgi:hypothetical protein